MNIDQFWDSTFREVSIYRLAAERRQLSVDRGVRSICYSIYLQYAAKPVKRITEFMPLPGDRPPKKWSDHLPGDYLSEDEFVQAMKQRNEAYKKERQQTIDANKKKALDYQQKLQQNGNK